MLTAMTEHPFPGGGRPRGHDALDAAVLHRLLSAHPRPLNAEHVAADLAGRPPRPREIHGVRRALTRLARDGLVHLTGAGAHPSRAARRFHRLLLGGDTPSRGGRRRR